MQHGPPSLEWVSCISFLMQAAYFAFMAGCIWQLGCIWWRDASGGGVHLNSQICRKKAYGKTLDQKGVQRDFGPNRHTERLCTNIYGMSHFLFWRGNIHFWKHRVYTVISAMYLSTNSNGYVATVAEVVFLSLNVSWKDIPSKIRGAVYKNAVDIQKIG